MKQNNESIRPNQTAAPRHSRRIRALLALAAVSTLSLAQMSPPKELKVGISAGTGEAGPEPLSEQEATCVTLTLQDLDSSTGNSVSDNTDCDGDADTLYCETAEDDGTGDVEFALDVETGSYVWAITNGQATIASGTLTAEGSYCATVSDLPEGCYSLEVAEQGGEDFLCRIESAAQGGTGPKRQADLVVSPLKTETVATVPAERTRRKVGVGEQVTLTLLPASVTQVSWSISGSGTLTDASGNPVTSGNPVIFTASDRASAPATAPTITATHAGTPHSVTLTVVEPSGLLYEQEAGTGIYHVQGVPSVGFKGRPYVQPVDVSFYNVEMREESVAAVATGYFAYQNGQIHEQGPWATVGAVVAKKGSKVNVVDTIQGGTDNHTPYAPGTFTWAIPVSFRVGTGDPKPFCTVNHVKTIDANGKLTMSKGGTTKSAALNASSSDY